MRSPFTVLVPWMMCVRPFIYQVEMFPRTAHLPPTAVSSWQFDRKGRSVDQRRVNKTNRLKAVRCGNPERLPTLQSIDWEWCAGLSEKNVWFIRLFKDQKTTDPAVERACLERGVTGAADQGTRGAVQVIIRPWPRAPRSPWPCVWDIWVVGDTVRTVWVLHPPNQPRHPTNTPLLDGSLMTHPLT
jgi:hypothetical protein